MIFAIIIHLWPVLLIIILLIGVLGGSSNSAPINPPATEEKTYKYKYIGSELGTPWDIVLLADAILAEQEGKSGIEDYNPILTSLQFCVITESKYNWVEKKSKPKKGTKEKKKPSGEWVFSEKKTYKGKDQILDYLGYNDNNITYKDASNLIVLINKKALDKSDNSVKYESVLTVNSDFEEVLKDYIQLDEENIKKVMELYDSKYLVYLYGYDSDSDSDTTNVTLPNLVVGNVTREDLANVAVSLINHPYLFGAKSPYKGEPKGALDCSGFVDWVYIQCFGSGVSGGRLPSGVAMSGTAMQYFACSAISESELKVGDLGFYSDPTKMSRGSINHVGIYIGKINGRNAFIHCGGRYFGFDERPRGRVGISINASGTYNSYNNITGGTFSPAIPGTNFRFFRRPNFQFKNDIG